MRLLSILFALLLTCSTSIQGEEITQSLPPRLEVNPTESEDHKGEVLRRGDLVTSTGEFNSNDECEAYEALSVPEDDSDKWYITLVCIEDCPPCVAMKKAINDGKLEAWVNANDSVKSWSHYGVRFFDDPLQRDWFKGIKDLKSFPKLIIQPPRNGKYGPNPTIVAMLNWDLNTDKDMKELSARIRSSIVEYTKTIKEKKSFSRGAKQSQETGVGATPKLPFDLEEERRKTRDELPDEIPPRRKMSAKDMRQLIPEADSEFILEQLVEEEEDPEKLQLKWEVVKNKRKRDTPQPAQVQPTTPSTPVDVVTPSGVVEGKRTPREGAIDLVSKLTGMEDQLKSATGLLDILNQFQKWASVLGCGLLAGIIGIVILVVQCLQKMKNVSGVSPQKFNDLAAILQDAFAKQQKDSDNQKKEHNELASSTQAALDVLNTRLAKLGV